MSSNDLTAPPPDDDGFAGSLQSGRLLKGMFAKWTDSAGWHDRDGMPLPPLVLVITVFEFLQRWSNKRPDIITEKPLPDPETLNSNIPEREWELDLNGKPRPPWAHAVGAYLVDPASGAIFTYANSTMGAHMAIDQLREATMVMRSLRGARVTPLVKPTSRPFKTAFGMRTRPFFQIENWRAPGGEGGMLPPSNKPPQLIGPTTTPAAAAPAARATFSSNPGPVAAPPIAPATPSTPPAPPASPPQTKPAAAVAAETVATMEPVKAVTFGELVGDEIPW
jgi:hypothetical protein